MDDSEGIHLRHLRRLIPYLGTYKKYVALCLTSVVFAATLVLVGPLMVGWAFNLGLKPVGEGNNITSLEGNQTFLVLAALSLIAFALGRGIAAFGQQFLAENIGQRVAYDIRNDIYDHLQRSRTPTTTTRRSGRSCPARRRTSKASACS